ncbi:unnamed protein product [Strongylus vulgaris]|uniref:Sec23/Sec24 trunk domain-containing protein n=1 Tax=Strongylus vulgaris TaxID=40348 RepID=A0A3P7INU7_STRVU|nr:unnamed protein product [Strongylus vulgaris]
MRTTVFAPHVAHSTWAAGSSPAYPSDIVDLMAERNILQEGFDDIEYTLPHNMANNTARVDPRYESLPDDFCWDPNTKSFGDPVNRPEIRYPTVEFIAPNEYMLRPPQPAVYVFVLDVSAAAVEAGYLFAFSEQLLINLDQLPGDDRTQVAFVAVDSMVHFFQFSSGSRRLPKELIVDEVDGLCFLFTFGITYISEV